MPDLPLSANELLQQATHYRHHLHQHPELSGQEHQTHDWLVKTLSELAPTATIYPGLGSLKTGLLVAFKASQPGPTVLLRADTDALPIVERNHFSFRSKYPGIMHACGHDGHTALLVATAQWVSLTGLKKGSLLLLFQPSEENGKGALSLLQDPLIASLKPDYIYGLHNIPGEPLGKILTREREFCFASTGIKVRFTGSSSHAAEPEKCHSPALALAQAVNLGQAYENSIHKKLAVTHAQLGEPSYGICPGEAIIQFTLRAQTDGLLEQELHSLTARLNAIAEHYGLDFELKCVEPFAATVNHGAAMEQLKLAFQAADLEHQPLNLPYFWSEDFGQYSQLGPTCFFGLGSGIETPPLHHPNYNFPDNLIPGGLRVWQAVITHFLH